MFIQLNDLNDCLQRSETEPVILFKHSAICPISSYALMEIEKFMKQSTVPVFLLVVQEQRALSNEIAETFGVIHQSPQAICIHHRQVLASISHYKINLESLKAVFSE